MQNSTGLLSELQIADVVDIRQFSLSSADSLPSDILVCHSLTLLTLPIPTAITFLFFLFFLASGLSHRGAQPDPTTSKSCAVRGAYVLRLLDSDGSLSWPPS